MKITKMVRYGSVFLFLAGCAHQRVDHSPREEPTQRGMEDEGGLEKEAIDEKIRQHLPELRGCYEQQLATDPKLRGRIQTSFVISATGAVSRAKVVSSTMKNKKVTACILDVIKGIPFPLPKGGGVVEVDYPFNFTPGEGE